MQLEVYDDFLDQKTIDLIVKCYGKELNYGWKSSHNQYDQGHWQRMIVDQGINRADISARLSGLLYEVWENITSKIGHRKLIRCYVNGYTFGTDGYIHRDEEHLGTYYNDQSSSETIIIYLNKFWHPNWAGETVLFNHDGTEIMNSVLPKCGRMIVFDASTLHAARPVSRICPELRLVLVFKTQKIIHSNEENRLLDKNRQCFEFLKSIGTEKINHSGTTLFEHLYGTARNLVDWNQDRRVCLAGLFHNIYGTEFFQMPNVVTREKIIELIGPYSEKLVYLFCNVRPRENLFKILTHIIKDEIFVFSSKEQLDLAYIEYANLLDQVQRLPHLKEKLDQQKIIINNLAKTI